MTNAKGESKTIENARVSLRQVCTLNLVLCSMVFWYQTRNVVDKTSNFDFRFVGIRCLGYCSPSTYKKAKNIGVFKAFQYRLFVFTSPATTLSKGGTLARFVHIKTTEP